MSADSLNQLLNLYTWFLLTALLFFLLLIGRFYERFSGERTHFRIFLVPAALFGVEVVHRSAGSPLGQDWFGALMSGAAGVVLIVLCLRLYRQMTVGRHR